MTNSVKSLTIRMVMTDSSRYIVPIYQRNYDWGEAEIAQLIGDIYDVHNKLKTNGTHQTYHLGTLTVFERKDGTFEIIDGQQRFTTLTLIFLYIKNTTAFLKSEKPNENKLEFEFRPRSTQTLHDLHQGFEFHKMIGDQYNQSMLAGYELVERELGKYDEKHLRAFCHYFYEHVNITRVPVPEDTDLNHYFEIMNTRGEQLEKHEVVKARLLSHLLSIEEGCERKKSSLVLSKVWDAVANMERYVQFGFDTNERERIFGNEWDTFKPEDYQELAKLIIDKDSNTGDNHSNARTLQDILEASPDNSPNEIKNESPERFTSVINFSNFLLHALQIFTGKKVPFDDKQLLEQFDTHIEKSENPAQTTKSFAYTLLKIRFLFDRYIIKREFSDGGEKWSLKRLNKYNSDRSDSQSYINTFNTSEVEEDGFKGTNRQVIKLLRLEILELKSEIKSERERANRAEERFESNQIALDDTAIEMVTWSLFCERYAELTIIDVKEIIGCTISDPLFASGIRLRALHEVHKNDPFFEGAGADWKYATSDFFGYSRDLMNRWIATFIFTIVSAIALLVAVVILVVKYGLRHYLFTRLSHQILGLEQRAANAQNQLTKLEGAEKALLAIEEQIISKTVYVEEVDSEVIQMSERHHALSEQLNDLHVQVELEQERYLALRDYADKLSLKIDEGPDEIEF